MNYFLRKLLKRRIWRKLFVERLSEPIHLNFISFLVLIFGSLKQKIAFDLVVRQQHAYGILESAIQARAMGLKAISVIEFGVASGAGILNMISIGRKVTRATGVDIRIFGFDTGEGMPKPVDYRDHPDLYNVGDFPMNRALLEKTIDGKATLLYGEIGETMAEFNQLIDENCPIGFVSVDVDYYSSATEALKVFDFPALCYLPMTPVYFDDTSLLYHNSLCGELLAIREYNARNQRRVIERHEFLSKYRIFKNALWLNQIYFFHVLDHPRRSSLETTGDPRVLENAYLSYGGNADKFDRK
jgi:hypothetical protein